MPAPDTRPPDAYSTTGTSPPVAQLTFPPELVAVIADAVAERLGDRQPAGYLNTRSAASYLDVPVSTVQAEVRARRLEPVQRRRRMLFTRDALDAWARG